MEALAASYWVHHHCTLAQSNSGKLQRPPKRPHPSLPQTHISLEPMHECTSDVVEVETRSLHMRCLPFSLARDSGPSPTAETPACQSCFVVTTFAYYLLSSPCAKHVSYAQLTSTFRHIYCVTGNLRIWNTQYPRFGGIGTVSLYSEPHPHDRWRDAFPTRPTSYYDLAETCSSLLGSWTRCNYVRAATTSRCLGRPASCKKCSNDESQMR